MASAAPNGPGSRPALQDLLSLVSSFFAGDKFDSQPRFVVQAGCGDGALLVRTYELVKETARGKAVKDYPLTMVGVGEHEESLIAPKISMCAKKIPHKVLTGDIAHPAALVSALKHKKIELKRTLFLQVCADRKRVLAEALSGPAAAFARQVTGDLADSEALFAALCEEARRFAELAEGAAGLCLAEVHSHARGPEVFAAPATLLAMAAAMAGLFPQDVKLAQPYPMRDEAGSCDVFCQVLSSRNFRARFAVPEDLPALEVLEEMAWKPHMRAPREGLLKRLQASPTTNFAFEVDGKVVAVLYTQRIRKPEDVYKQKFQQVFEGHVENGPVLQLIAINAHTEHRGLGSELRCFALHLARLDPTIESVCAVTLCRNFATSGIKNMQQYVDMHLNGRVDDQILTFHTGYGAKVLGLVPGYRPEDTENQATGVLIQYKPKEWVYEPAAGLDAGDAAEASSKQELVKKDEPQVPSLEILSDIMTEMGYEIDMENLDQGFFSSGLDSFDMGVIQNRLGRALGRTLPATLMLDLPTVKELTEHLDKERGVGRGGGAAEAEALVEVAEERRERPERRTERASDETITEWVRCWRQHLYKKQKARGSTPRSRRSRSAGRNRGPSPWETMSVEELEKIQVKLAWLLRLPQNQRRLQNVVGKAHDNDQLFLCELRVVLDSLLGPLFVAMGLVQDTKPRTMQDARDDMESCALAFGGEAAARHKELLHLMKLDVVSSFPQAPTRSASPIPRGPPRIIPPPMRMGIMS